MPLCVCVCVYLVPTLTQILHRKDVACTSALTASSPTPLRSCRILLFLTVRLSVPSAFERHDSLPTSIGMHRHVPPRRAHRGTSNTGTAWCILRKFVPEVLALVCVLLSPPWVVGMVCILLLSPRVVVSVYVLPRSP